MNRVLEGIDFDSAEEFVAFYNKERLSHKDRWITYSGKVCGKSVAIKSYNLWNQVIRIDGVTSGGLHDLKVSEWKEEIANAIGSVRRNPARRNVVRNPEKGPYDGKIIKKKDIDNFNRLLDPIRTFHICIEKYARAGHPEERLPVCVICVGVDGYLEIHYNSSFFAKKTSLSEMSVKKLEKKIDEAGIGISKLKNGITETDTKDPIKLLEAISSSQKNLVVWQPIHWIQ